MDEECYKYNERQGSIIDVYAYPYLSILVARGSGTISNCAVYGSMYSNQETYHAGLLAGYFNGDIQNCAAYGIVENAYNANSTCVGGLVGTLGSNGRINNSYAIVEVRGAEKGVAGGLIGNNYGKVEKVYSAGTVLTSSTIGGLVGSNSGTVNNSFYDSTISGLSDADKGIPKTSIEMRNAEIYDMWDFENCWSIHNKYNGGYPFLQGNSVIEAFAGYTTTITVFNGKDSSVCVQSPVLILYDEKGEEISRYIGNEDGTITLDNIVISRAYSIKLSASGYGDYRNEKYKIKAFCTNILILYPETTNPTVHCANIKFDNMDATDILQNRMTLLQKENTTFSLEVFATYVGGIENICLVQGGKIKATSQTGQFFELTARSFDCSLPIYIQIVGVDGVTSELCQTYLTISDFAVEDKNWSGSLDFGDLEIQIPSDIPFPGLGGATIKVNDLLKDLDMYQVGVSDGKIQVAVNICEFEGDNESFGSLEYAKMRKALDNKAGNPGYWSRLKKYIADYDSLIKSTDFVQMETFYTKGLPYKVKIFGYLEFDATTNKISEGQLAIYAGGSFYPFEAGFSLAGIPWVVIVDVGVDVEGNATAKISDDGYIWDLSGKFAFHVSAGTGPGIPRIASLTVNAKGEITFKYNWNTYLRQHSVVVDLTASTYWQLTILSFEVENNITEQTWCLYDSNAQSARAFELLPCSLQQQTNSINYTVSDVVEDSAWNAGNMGVIENGTDIELLSRVYTNSSVQIAKMGDDMMLVYLHQNTSRSAINATEVMYSIYDSATQQWSLPKAVNDDGTADFYPHVVESEGEVYVVWENLREVVTEEIGLNELSELGNISIAKYDPSTDAFTTCTSVTDGMLTMPYLDVEAGKVIWVLNDTEDFLNDSSYSINIADYDGTAISGACELKSGIEHLLMAKIGIYGAQPVVAYVCDLDGDYYTVDDHILIIIDMQGNILYESAQAQISDMEFVDQNGQKVIAYSENGNIKILNNYVPQLLIEGNIPVVGQFVFISGDMEYIVFEVPNSGMNSEKDLYAYTFDLVSGKWNNAVALTNQTAQITMYDAIESASGIQLVYQQTDVNDHGENASLHIMKVEPFINLSIDNLVYDEERNKVSLAMDIINNGVKAVTGYNVAIYDGTTILYTENVSETVGVGNSVQYEMELETVSITGYEKELTVVVVPIAGSDWDESDNVSAIVVGYPDVSVNIADEGYGDNLYIASLELYNEGNWATSGHVNVYVSDNLIDSINVSELKPDAYCDLQVKIDTTQLDLDNYVDLIKYEFVADLHELYLHNNIVCSNVYVKMDSVLGSVDAEDVNIAVGGKIDLGIVFTAATGNANRLLIMPMSYTIENPMIASISEEGVVTGITEGTTLLTVIATDTYGNRATDTCTIVVTSATTEGTDTSDNVNNSTENSSAEQENDVPQEAGSTDTENMSEDVEDKDEDFNIQEEGEKDSVVDVEGIENETVITDIPNVDSVDEDANYGQNETASISDNDNESIHNDDKSVLSENVIEKESNWQCLIGSLLLIVIICFTIWVLKRKFQDREEF